MELLLEDNRSIEGRESAARLALAGLFAVEAAALGLRFDGRALVGDRWLWTALANRAPVALQLAIAVAALVAMRRFTSVGLAAREEPAGRPGWASHLWPWMVGHLAALAAFLLVSGPIVEGHVRTSARPGPWLLAWAGAGALMLATGAVGLLPAEIRRRLTRQTPGALLAATTVGVVALVAGYATHLAWQPLGWATLRLVRALLALAFGETVYQPEEQIVGTPGFSIRVAPSCSGLEGIGLIWVFLGAYLWACRRDLAFPRAWFLLPLGTALVWLGNVVRITALVAVGRCYSPEVAVGGFHSQAGWIAFNVVGLGLIAVSRKTRFFRRTDLASAPVPAVGIGPGPDPTASYLAPLMALVATSMIGGAFVVGFDATYPVRVLAVVGALWAYRRGYAGLRFGWSWEAVAIGIGVFALWMALEPSSRDSAAGTAIVSGLAGLSRPWAIAWLVARVVGSVVTVPVAEELAFRGFLTRRLIAADFAGVPGGRFTWPSWLISSILFGALHGRWLAGTLAGLLFALALYRRGRLGDAVLAHATANALIAATVLTTGWWGLWA